MGKIFSKLPAFAADYSGAASVFYDMNGILVTYDAGSCAGSYWMIDEPRISHEMKKFFSAELREKKIVLGADKDIKERVKKTYEELGAECIAIFGTPVPTVIGVDFQGLAREIHNETSIPTFGIETNGLDFYDAGQRKSYESLLKYCDQVKAENVADVNVIGATPLDMWDLNQIKDMICFLKNAGAKNPVVWGANGKLREIGGAHGAKLNIAVSVSAIPIVKEMNRKYGTPYLVGYPIGEVEMTGWSAKVGAFFKKPDEDIQSKKKDICTDKIRIKESDKKVEKSILIIGEQVASNSLRKMLRTEYGCERIDVISYFQMFEEYMEKNDVKLEWETELTELLSNRMMYDIVIGDPHYFSLFPYVPKKMIQQPHIAVSQILFMDKSPNCFGEKGSRYFQMVL